VSKHGLMAQDMKVSGDKIKRMEEAEWFTQMVTSMMANGRPTKLMEKASFLMLMAQDTKEIGRMTCSMGKEWKSGTTAQRGTWASFTKVRRMEEEGSSGKTDRTMKATLLMACFKAMESTTLLMSKSFIGESSELTTWKVEDKKTGKMERGMKEILRTEGKTEKEFLNGPMEISTSEVGQTAKCMASEFITVKKQEKRNKANG